MISTCPKQRRSLPTLIASFLWLWAAYGWAAPTAVVNTLEQPFNLGPHIEYVEDPRRALTLDQILHQPQSWKRHQGDSFIGSNTRIRYWFRFHIHNPTNQTPLLYIPQQQAFLFKLNLWLPESDGSRRLIETGNYRPYHQRDVDSQIFTFKLPSDMRQYTVVGWIDNVDSGMPALLPLHLIGQQAWQKEKEVSQAFLVAFYAMMAALFLYNLFLFISLRQLVYGIYVLFLFEAAISCGFIDGSLNHWLLPNDPYLAARIQIINGVMVPLCYLLFVWQALDRFSFSPTLRKVSRWTFAGAILAILFNSVSEQLFYTNIITQSVSTWVIPLCLVAIVMAIFHRVKTAGFLLLAELCTIAGGTVFMLVIQGIIPINPVNIWSLHAGFLLESLLLSLALAEHTRLAQQAALDNLTNYEALYEDSIEGRFQYSLKDGAIKYNQSMAEICDFDTISEHQLKYRISHLSDEATNLIIERKLNHQSRITDFEMEIDNGNSKKPTWVSANMRMLRDKRGKPERVEGSIIDITERKLKEDALREKAITDAKAQGKSQFFASMSHELRTPLTAILGYTEIALDPTLTDQERLQHLYSIDSGGRHLLQLVNDVLDLSKVEAQKLEVEAIPVNIPLLMQELHDCFTVLADKKSIKFAIDYQLPTPEFIISDPTRLKQTLINLCGNAIKFTDQGVVRVRIHCDAEQQQMHFAVQDTGIGLKPEQVEKLFGAFNQADSSTTRQFGGTGLGLHLSRQIALKLGGDIQVNSRYQQGSTFTLTVTSGSLAQANWLEEIPSLQMSRQLSTKVPALRGRILYAEDNPQNQQLVANFVDRTGASLDVASNGLNALTLGIEKDYDLILTDIRMPLVDGVEMTRSLLQHKPDLPIVAITATATNAELEEFSSAGFCQVLRKPIDRQKLYHCMSQYLNSADDPNQNSASPPPVVQPSVTSVRPAASNAAHQQADKDPELSPIRVLLADDNPVNQKLIAFHIRKVGAEAVLAEDGVEAIAAAVSQPVDLVLMDMEMPTMDGMTAVRYLRAKGFEKPIYALTANESDAAIQECLEAGCHGHLSKPLDSSRLKAVIESCQLATIKHPLTQTGNQTAYLT